MKPTAQYSIAMRCSLSRGTVTWVRSGEMDGIYYAAMLMTLNLFSPLVHQTFMLLYHVSVSRLSSRHLVMDGSWNLTPGAVHPWRCFPVSTSCDLLRQYSDLFVKAWSNQEQPNEPRFKLGSFILTTSETFSHFHPQRSLTGLVQLSPDCSASMHFPTPEAKHDFDFDPLRFSHATYFLCSHQVSCISHIRLHQTD